MTVSIIAFGHFVNAAVGATGLTVTVDVDRFTRSDGTRSQIVTAGSATEGSNGVYFYRIASGDLSLYDYLVMFKTTGTADQKNIPSMWSSYSIDNTASIAAIPTTTAPTVAAIRTEMDANSTKLDVAVSTRNAVAPDNASIGTILSRTDVATSTRLASSGYTAPDNTDIVLIKAKTDNLPSDPASNTQVNTRLATANYIAPDNTSVASILAKTDVATSTRMAQASIPTPPTVIDIADAVWDESLSAHTASGSTGESLLLAGKLAGNGPIEWSYTLVYELSQLAVPQAYVWVTSDVAGHSIVAEGVTSNSGIVTFYLTAGTYYIWRAKAGWLFTNPDTETVS